MSLIDQAKEQMAKTVENTKEKLRWYSYRSRQSGSAERHCGRLLRCSDADQGRGLHRCA